MIKSSEDIHRAKNKILVIVGPTASGKTSLSVWLAKKFNGEIISADSRQVYRGMDIGTGKVTKYEMMGIPHYLLDVASPNSKFTAARYKSLATKALKQIWKNTKLPIIVGGTGFYIQAVVDNMEMPKVAPDWKLRGELEKKSAKDLFSQLEKLDPTRAKNIDKYNKRRLIRALEIIIKTGHPVPTLPDIGSRANLEVLVLGVKRPKKELNKLIEKRLIKRLKTGMVEEVEKLHKSGVSWRRLEEFGLEYRCIAMYLQKKMPYEEMVLKLQKEIEHYAKRQMTWFKRDKRIKWTSDKAKAAKLTKKFLK